MKTKTSSYCVTIYYSEDLAGGWDIFYTDGYICLKESFTWGDEDLMKAFISSLLSDEKPTKTAEK